MVPVIIMAFRNMEIILGISPKIPYVLLKYLGGLHSHLQNKMILFKPTNNDEAYVKEHYLENIFFMKGYLSGYKQKYH
jgi:hypothetical protein